MLPAGLLEPVIGIILPTTRSTSTVGNIPSTSSMLVKSEDSNSSTITFKCSKMLSKSSISFSLFYLWHVLLFSLFRHPHRFWGQRSFRHGLVDTCPLRRLRLFWVRIGYVVGAGALSWLLRLHGDRNFLWGGVKTTVGTQGGLLWGTGEDQTLPISNFYGPRYMLCQVCRKDLPGPIIKGRPLIIHVSMSDGATVFYIII